MKVLEQFAGKKVLITGHTGFKGTWLSLWLSKLGAEVHGVSVDLPSEPSNFDVLNLGNSINDIRLDIRDSHKLTETVKDIQPDFVFHLAAQALVRPSYAKPVDTFTTNATGTVNVLDSLRELNKKVSVVMITSDKAYDNVEWIWGYRETDKLGGKDPYSASKGMAELAIRSYVESYFNNENSNISLGVARAGNVIGGGDWAEDRLVPDCMISWSKNYNVDIRSPHATRPWQHVLEPLSGYISLAANLYNSSSFHGEAFNFGPPAEQNYPVSELITEMKKYWDNVSWNDVSMDAEHLHEAGLLKLNCDKALAYLKWHPTLRFEETVKFTVEWYRLYYDSKALDMNEFTNSQIDEYVSLAESRQLNWAKHD